MIQPHLIEFIPSADHVYQDGEMVGKPASFELSPQAKSNRAADVLTSAVGVMNTQEYEDAPGVVLYFFDRALDTQEFSDTRPFAPDYKTLKGYLGQVFLWTQPETVGTSELSVSAEYHLNQPVYAISGMVYIYAVYMTNDVDSDAQPAPMAITLCVEYEVKR